jgi:hypothetical protein
MGISGYVKEEHEENGNRVIDKIDLTHVSIDELDFAAWAEFDKIVDASEPPEEETPKTISDWIDWLTGR